MIPLGVATGASDSVATGASVETTPPPAGYMARPSPAPVVSWACAALVCVFTSDN